MREHPLAAWYLKVVEENVLHTSSITIETQAGAQGITDATVVQRAKDMVQELKEQQRFFVNKLIRRGATQAERTKLQEKAAKTFIAFQKKFGAPAHKWKDHSSFEPTILYTMQHIS